MMCQTETTFFALSTLVVAAGQVFREPAQSSPLQYFEYNARAISLLRHSLAMPHPCANDATIMAIVLFALTELAPEHSDRYALHRAQLDKMVAARGGLASFSQDSYVKMAMHK